MQRLLGGKAFIPTANEENAVQLSQKPGEDFARRRLQVSVCLLNVFPSFC